MVVTVIGVSFILKTELLACLLERKAKVSSPVDDCPSVATIHHIIFSANVLYTEILLAPPCAYLITNSGTHVCKSSLSSITDKPLCIRILFIMFILLHYTPYVW